MPVLTHSMTTDGFPASPLWGGPAGATLHPPSYQPQDAQSLGNTVCDWDFINNNNNKNKTFFLSFQINQTSNNK